MDTYADDLSALIETFDLKVGKAALISAVPPAPPLADARGAMSDAAG